jgi:hypothetical protein
VFYKYFSISSEIKFNNSSTKFWIQNDYHKVTYIIYISLFSIHTYKMRKICTDRAKESRSLEKSMFASPKKCCNSTYTHFLFAWGKILLLLVKESCNGHLLSKRKISKRLNVTLSPVDCGGFENLNPIQYLKTMGDVCNVSG